MTVTTDRESSAASVSELRVLRDTKIVLGHWYALVLPNAMALQDFSALGAMVQVSLGHARVLDSLVRHGAGLPPTSAVTVADRDELASMVLLDRPPSDWTDFVTAVALSEWAVEKRLRTVSADGGRVGDTCARLLMETSFVLDYVRGWLRVLADSATDRVHECLEERVRDLRTWYPSDAGPELHEILAQAAEFAPTWTPDDVVADRPPWDATRRRPEGSLVPAALANGIADRELG